VRWRGATRHSWQCADDHGKLPHTYSHIFCKDTHFQTLSHTLSAHTLFTKKSSNACYEGSVFGKKERIKKSRVLKDKTSIFQRTSLGQTLFPKNNVLYCLGVRSGEGDLAPSCHVPQGHDQIRKNSSFSFVLQVAAPSCDGIVAVATREKLATKWKN